MYNISYKSGFKYQLFEDYFQINTGIKPPEKPIHLHFIILNNSGDLTVKKGYAWDGPSGPAIDTKSFMRASLVHDAFYQLMRRELIDASRHRLTADNLLKAMCLEDGMCRIRAWWVYKSVHWFASPAAKEQNSRVEIIAP